MDVRGTAGCSACDDIILFRVAVLLCYVMHGHIFLKLLLLHCKLGKISSFLLLSD